MSESNTKRVKVIVLCRNSAGESEFHSCTPEVTQEQYDNGDHYDLAKENAADNGFEEPMVAFDQNDGAARQLGELVAWVKP